MTPVPVPLVDHPILRIDNDRPMVCAGDLHVGIESELDTKGIHVPSQTQSMEEELLSIDCGGSLVLLGDIKHNIPSSSPQEYSEIPLLLRRLSRKFESVEVVKGNHDGNLEDFIPAGVHLHPPAGFTKGGVGFIHGHTWPSREVMSSELVVIAHLHPAFLFIDNLDKTTTEMCWLRGSFSEVAHQHYDEVPEELIVVPALNRNLGGSAVNVKAEGLLGPLFAQGLVDRRSIRVHLLDGVYLGRLSDLMVRRAQRSK